MATDMKRFTISVTSELEQELLQLKQEQFYNTTQSKMIRVLIEKGLDAEKSGSLEPVG